MYYVYLLKLVTGDIYTGSTPDLKRRLIEHKQGKSLATKNHLPVNLIWFCAFKTRLDARRFENYLNLEEYPSGHTGTVSKTVGVVKPT